MNDVLMEPLANDGDGNYAYVDEINNAQKLFVEDLTSTFIDIGRQAVRVVEYFPEDAEAAQFVRLVQQAYQIMAL